MPPWPEQPSRHSLLRLVRAMGRLLELPAKQRHTPIDRCPMKNSPISRQSRRFHRPAATFSILCAALCAATLTEADPRTWTSADGSKTFEGELRAIAG